MNPIRPHRDPAGAIGDVPVGGPYEPESAGGATSPFGMMTSRGDHDSRQEPGFDLVRRAVDRWQCDNGPGGQEHSGLVLTQVRRTIS